MFGTLVICLPSKHTGGAVLLHHGAQSKKLSTAKTSANGYCNLAWFADVTHEIELLETGYRWVLIYNLIRVNTGNESSRTSATMLGSRISSLRNDLSLRETQERPPEFLVYALDHQYTARNLRLSRLKGRDYQRASCLDNVCNQHGKFFLFLAQLNRRETWDNWQIKEHSMLTCKQYLHPVCTL
ncbi:hypothetical protein ACQKWADRAFT_19269 [Trichoderma austrokoningii]